jgi:hypothetical protein
MFMDSGRAGPAGDWQGSVMQCIIFRNGDSGRKPPVGDFKAGVTGDVI